MIDESEILLSLGEKIQDETLLSQERDSALRRLSDKYHVWYRAAFNLFDARDQSGGRQRFEEEYEGSFFSPKIIKFLTEGLQINPLYEPNKPEMFDKWTYPFVECFKEPLLKKSNILAGISYVSSIPTPDEEHSNEWNQTISGIFKVFLEKADSANTNNEKKLTYEYLAIFLIGAIEGFTVIGHDERGTSEEIDLWVSNESTDSFWQRMGNPFIVECKNWGKPAGVQEIRHLSAIMGNKGVQFAILLSKNGITGDRAREADGEIRNAFKDNKFILVLDQTDLLEVAQGVHLEDLIKRKHYDLYMKY